MLYIMYMQYITVRRQWEVLLLPPTGDFLKIFLNIPLHF